MIRGEKDLSNISQRSIQTITDKAHQFRLAPESLEIINPNKVSVFEVEFGLEARRLFRDFGIEGLSIVHANLADDSVNRDRFVKVLTQGYKLPYDPEKWSSLLQWQEASLEECLNMDIREVLPRHDSIQFDLREQVFDKGSRPLLDGSKFSSNPRVHYRQVVGLGKNPDDPTKSGVLLLITSGYLGGIPSLCGLMTVNVCALELDENWKEAVRDGRFIQFSDKPNRVAGSLPQPRFLSSGRESGSYPLRGFEYSGDGWRAVQEGVRRAERILEANSRTQDDTDRARSQAPRAAVKVEQPTRWLSEYQPAIDNEEGHFLDLLKTKPGEAFEQMRSQTEDFPDIIAGRFPAGTKAAKFGSKATPVRLLRKEDRMMIVLEGLNTEELIRQVATEALNLSSLETCLGQAGSSDSFVMEIDGLAGNWQIKTGIARIDIGRMQYADVIPYLRSQIVNQSRVRPDFSEQELRRYLKEGFGTAEALAYVFSRLKASEESRSGIKKMTREDYLRVYGPKPKRKSYYYADW